MKIGDAVIREKTITENEVKLFAELSGDKNPIHLNDDYAKNTIFKKRIVQGILVAGQISAILANDLPGEGTIYLKQELNFVKPVFIGDKVLTKVAVLEIREDKPIARLETNCLVHNEIVIQGFAIVKFSQD